jgi:hypothetical protein
MTTKKAITPARAKKAAAELKLTEALTITEVLRRDLHFKSDSLALLLLLLFWLANHADESERETLAIEAEVRFGGYIKGTDEAIEAQMRRQLDALKGDAR